jgi:DNA-binding SARP family transcriptional activator
LNIQLLGGFSIIYGEKPLSAINTARLQSLLTYLVLNANIPQPRQQIAFQLWPDTSESNARNNLRQFLHQLRRDLPDPDRFLMISTNTVCWHRDASQEIDIERFEHCLVETEAAELRADLDAARSWLTAALSSYQGDLLPSCYDDWIISYREHLQQRYYGAWQNLVRVMEQQRDYTAALQAAKSLLSLDPLDENTNVTLMRLYDLDQNRSAARRVYQTAVETLRHELGVEPSETLRLAYERLQSPFGTQFPEVEAVPLTLIGRQAEWQQLQKLW